MSEISVSAGQKKENDKVMWILRFVSVIFLTLLIMFGRPGAERWWIAGVVFVILVHLKIIWNFIMFCMDKEELHEYVKIYIYGFFIFLGTICLFAPDKAEDMSNFLNNQISFRANPQPNVGKTVGETPEQKIVIRDPPPQTLYLVPGENFRSPVIPYGARIIDNITADCPLSCITQVDHDSDQLCVENGTGDYEVDRHGKKWLLGTYQGSKCMFTIVSGGGGAIRYRERFLLKKSKVDFPTNLVNVIYSFGTNTDLGPVVAKVRIATR